MSLKNQRNETNQINQTNQKTRDAEPILRYLSTGFSMTIKKESAIPNLFRNLNFFNQTNQRNQKNEKNEINQIKVPGP